jgi:hypothetical protein
LPVIVRAFGDRMKFGAIMGVVFHSHSPFWFTTCAVAGPSGSGAIGSGPAGG